MTRGQALRGAFLALAALHTLPATHHLRDFVAAPGVADGWKGFGACAAIALLGAGPRALASVIARLRRLPRPATLLVRAALVAAHAVPLYDDLPRALVAPSWSDGWRAAGSLIAIVLVVGAPAWLRAARAVRQSRSRRATIGATNASCATRA